MAKYKELKNALRKERKKIYDELRENISLVDKYKKIYKIVHELKENDIENVDFNKLLGLKKYFPDLEDEFNTLRRFINYKIILCSNNASAFDYNNVIIDIRESSHKYNVPPAYALKEIEQLIEIINNIKSGNVNKLSKEEMDIFLGKSDTNNHVLYVSIMAACHCLSMDILNMVVGELEEEKNNVDVRDKNEKISNRINLIEEFSQKISDDKVLSKFTDEELDRFKELITSILDKDICEEIINNIRNDQEIMDIVTIEVDFSNLDMSIFTLEERKIIEQIRDIYEDEDLSEIDNSFENIKITYNDRLIAYKKASINCVLQDVKNLLNNIYDNKDEVINIFKLIIDMYQKYNIRVVREEKKLELEKIKNEFNNIISFINKTYKNREKAYNEETELKEYIESIDIELLPMISELIDIDYYDDDYYDNKIDILVLKYKNVMHEWKKEMTSFYQQDGALLETKENTDNLVICLNEDIDLSKEGFIKEFNGTLESLHYKTSKELKTQPGRKGMSRIRKSTGTNKSIDFVKYLDSTYKMHVHFVPYRYSSSLNYRTGLIKFSPSFCVKEFLEEKYGLSSQSAIYGIFEVIEVIGADHSAYHIFGDYISNNYLTIESIASLLASNNPDYEKIIDVLDGMLSIKKELINKANSVKKI